MEQTTVQRKSLVNEKIDGDSIVPLTTKMLIEALGKSEDDLVKIDGLAATKFEIVGKIEHVSEMENQFILHIGDGFGVIRVMCIKVFNETKPNSLQFIDLA